MADATFQRARRPEHKLQRREAILTAARELALRDGVRNVSLGAVAREVGLAKSNVLRYFETREEIYLHLTVAAWREWVDTLHERLDPGATADEVANILAETLVERPLLCDLLVDTPANLEHNVSQEVVRDFKHALLPIVAEASELLAATLPALGHEGGFELVALTTLLAGSMWPVANPPPLLAELYETDPALEGACMDFAPTLRQMVRRFIAGFR